jgi:uncharacterized protein (TIGR03437 family)
VFKYIWLVLLAAAAASAISVNSPRLTYATYLGPESGSVLYGLAVDASGYAYASGTYGGCGFLTKLNQTGTALIWSVCLPMNEIHAVALDAAGYIYVAGNSQNQQSSDRSTSMILKLSPDAQQTLYTTSIEGTYATRLVLDRAGNAYITGSASQSFKATTGAYLTKGPATGLTAFAVKLNILGMVQYATYLDFISFPEAKTGDIAVDSMGQAWVVGATCPTSNQATCDLLQGTASAIRKLAANGATLLVKKTFGGGPGPDHAFGFRDEALGVAVDGTDSAWVVGTAETNNVPTTPNALEPQRPNVSFGPGLSFGYALKFSSSGDLLYGTYVGTTTGNGGNSIETVVVDTKGNPYFALNAAQPTAASLTGLSADGSTLLYSTDFNGPVQEMALDGKGGLYTAGFTARNRAFLTTPGVLQALYPGGPQSGYAAKFDLTTNAPSELSSLVNAASIVPGGNPAAPQGAVAPGEIVTLFGRSLPANPRVTFDSYQAPILYADANQINAVVPFEVSDPSTVVSVEGVGGFVLPVWPAVPGLFTLKFNGTGQVAALNQDESLNSNTNPAKAGSIVAVYMTGAGAMSPSIGDGQLGPLQPPFPAPILGASATINGVNAPISFIGQAPTLIAGAVQVNVQIPEGTASGNAVLIVYIGNYRTQVGLTTIAVH